MRDEYVSHTLNLKIDTYTESWFDKSYLSFCNAKYNQEEIFILAMLFNFNYSNVVSIFANIHLQMY